MVELVIGQIEQSSKILEFYNSNQIQKMKIKKGQATFKKTYIQSPIKQINELFDSFKLQIDNRKINVDIKHDDNTLYMETDWKIYQLIIFNIVQNAIKYNNIEGSILVSIKLHSLSEDLGSFETIIQNTGLGIAKERIPFLFEVFGELK